MGGSVETHRTMISGSTQRMELSWLDSAIVRFRDVLKHSLVPARMAYPHEVYLSPERRSIILYRIAEKQ